MDGTVLGALIGGAITIGTVLGSALNQNKNKGKTKKEEESAAELSAAPDMARQILEALAQVRKLSDENAVFRDAAITARSEAALAKIAMQSIEGKLSNLEQNLANANARIRTLEQENTSLVILMHQLEKSNETKT
jgi:hypothetical protein